jgi:3-oxoacyl-[acyl-carrier protein] reductase
MGMTTTPRPLAGKVAWVTGSSRGLGRVIATHLGRLGAMIVVHGTTPTSTRAFGEGSSLADVSEAIGREAGAEVLAVHGDLTDPDTVARLVGEIHARFGQIDVLVNNAGGDIGAAGTGGPHAGKPQPNDCVFIPVEDVRAILDRNLLSCILVCRAVAPEMIERRRGWIVNIGSVAAFVGRDDGAIYAAAKAGLTHYSRCLAAQLRPFNIPVNVVAPGGTTTPRFLAAHAIDQAKVDAEGTLNRYGRPEEVARAIEFLVSDPGPFVSGQVLRVDGGAQAWPA